MQIINTTLDIRVTSRYIVKELDIMVTSTMRDGQCLAAWATKGRGGQLRSFVPQVGLSQSPLYTSRYLYTPWLIYTVYFEHLQIVSREFLLRVLDYCVLSIFPRYPDIFVQ